MNAPSIAGMRAVDVAFYFPAVPGAPGGATDRAAWWCGFHGISVGRMQRGAPRGILFGRFDIQKWRNLSPSDRAALHGTFQRLDDGAVRVDLRFVPSDLLIRPPHEMWRSEGDTPYMPSAAQESTQAVGSAAPVASQIDGDDRLNAKRLAAGEGSL